MYFQVWINVLSIYRDETRTGHRNVAMSGVVLQTAVVLIIRNGKGI